MSSPDYVVSVIRLGLLIAPGAAAAHGVRRGFTEHSCATAALTEAILALAWLIVLAEALGVVGRLEFGWLVTTSWLAGALTLGALRVTTARPRHPVAPADD